MQKAEEEGDGARQAPIAPAETLETLRGLQVEHDDPLMMQDEEKKDM